MLFTYTSLKDMLQITANPYLAFFEQYCEDMRLNTRVLEWSCKFKGDSVEGGRFLHSALYPEFSEAANAVDHLYSNLFTGASQARIQASLFDWLRPIAKKVGRGISLGYAQQREKETIKYELKLYVVVQTITSIIPLIRHIVPAGANPPGNLSNAMVAASLDCEGISRARVYYLWERAHLEQEGGWDWLNQWCTSEEIRLIENSTSPTLSIAFKDGRRDMLYLSVPFGNAKIVDLVQEQVKVSPLAQAALDNLRWIGFSKNRECFDADEVNLYFNSVFR